MCTTSGKKCVCCIKLLHSKGFKHVIKMLDSREGTAYISATTKIWHIFTFKMMLNLAVWTFNTSSSVILSHHQWLLSALCANSVLNNSYRHSRTSII